MRAAVKAGLIVAVAVSVLASACSGDDTKPRPQAATTETTASTTPTTIGSTTTSVPADERPEIAVVRLLRLRNQAFAAPDPALADAYLAPECACYQQERTSLTNLQTQGWHWASPMFEVLGVKVVEASKPDLVTLTVVTRRPPERVVESGGALARPEGPGEEATGYSYLLVRKDGAWRIADNFKLDLSPDAIRQIMAAGVPS